MNIFEHKIIYLDDEADKIRQSSYAGTDANPLALFESVLDKFGDQGWELASVMTCPNPKNPIHLVATAWFKRELVTGADVPEPAPPA